MDGKEMPTHFFMFPFHYFVSGTSELQNLGINKKMIGGYYTNIKDFMLRREDIKKAKIGSARGASYCLNGKVFV